MTDEYYLGTMASLDWNKAGNGGNDSGELGGCVSKPSLFHTNMVYPNSSACG
jgi:hypothetical protein